MRKFFFLLCFLSVAALSQAQQSGADMADVMRSNGKIYVVLAVILIIFAGIVIYLIRLDRKIDRLENKNS